MRYLKKFKTINENNKPDDLLSFDEIEDYFIDIIDNDFEIHEVEISVPWRKIFDNGGYHNSEIRKEGFNFFRRAFEFKLKLRSDLDEIKKFSILTENQIIFLNCVKSITSAEGIVVLHLNSRIGTEIIFGIEFLEELIDSESDVDVIDEEIGDLYEEVKEVIIRKSFGTNVRWSNSDVKLSVKSGEIVADCSLLTMPQINKIIEAIRIWKSNLERSVKNNIRRLRNGEINQGDTDMFGFQIKFEYFDFSIQKKGNSFLISNIKKVGLN
jgi:hypothetical protein